jgi:phosphoribosylformylglycinamidine synthase
MALAGGMGVEINLSAVPTAGQPLSDTEILFAESLSRFLVQIKDEDTAEFEAHLSQAKVPFGQIGRTGPSTLKIQDQNGRQLYEYPLAELEHAWRGHIQSANTQYPLPASAPQLTGSKMVFNQAATPPPVLILHANGTNRDREAALACQVAGGEPEIVHVNQLLAGERNLLDYQMLVIPGGFSYGDDLGAGKLWALDLQERLDETLAQFVASGRPVLGICNGFQALVKSGLLPGGEPAEQTRQVTLTDNKSGRFECRWVYLRPNPLSPNLFTQGLESLIYCPVAHGEGRLAVDEEETAVKLQSDGLVALTYVDSVGNPAEYPANPNGSIMNIAGLSNRAGNVLGLMPHPEDHIFGWQHPRKHRGESGLSGLRLFENGIKYIKRG